MPASNSCVQSPVVNSAFGIDLNSLSAEEIAGLGETAERILNDPLLLQQLTDRVYRLLQDDLARQSERGLGRRSHGR
ncbi:MAG: hypothetical protein AB4050_17155 [Synechococcus sp.]